MSTNLLPTQQQNVILYILKHGVKTEYELQKEIVSKKGPITSTGTLHYILKELTKKKLLGFIESKECTRKKKPYHLTVLGLATALIDSQVIENLDTVTFDTLPQDPEVKVIIHTWPQVTPQMRENVNTIIKWWDTLLPRILGKWDVFVSAGVEGLALRKLIIAASVLLGKTPYPEYKVDLDQSMDLAKVFDNNFYHPFVGLDKREEHLRWAEACARDSKVHDYFFGTLEKVKLMCDDTKRRVEDMMDIMTQVLQDVKDADSE